MARLAPFLKSTFVTSALVATMLLMMGLLLVKNARDDHRKFGLCL